MEPDDAPTSDARIAEALAALASPTRLALLRELRQPKALREIEVRAEAGDGQPPRALARQTVKEHLERLVDLGIVRAREAHRPYGATVEYVLNHQALFAMAEDFRGLARLRPASEVEERTVQRAPRGPAAAQRGGPCLVLVHGLDEGLAFDLRPPVTGRGEWVIGRSRGAAVSLDFDPFVSTENATVVWDQGRHWVVDLPDSRNGTTLNFAPIPKGERRALRTGDVIGVGRTLLLFRED